MNTYLRRLPQNNIAGTHKVVKQFLALVALCGAALYGAEGQGLRPQLIHAPPIRHVDVFSARKSGLNQPACPFVARLNIQFCRIDTILVRYWTR